MIKNIRLLLRLSIISFKKIYVYKFELLMALIQLAFNFSFVIIFWYTILHMIPSVNGWSFKELVIYTSVVFLGDSLGGVFFGLRDMPEHILQGKIDKYLSRPVNVMISLLFEDISIIYFLEQFIVSILLLIIMIIKYNIQITALNMAVSIIILIAGTLIINFIFGILTFLSFWTGHIENIRNLLTGIVDAKQYPVTIFPSNIKSFLTYVIPISFASYYPCAILLGKEKINIIFVLIIIIYCIIFAFLFLKVWEKGIKKYESNGG